MSVDTKMLRELLAGAYPLPWSVWCCDDGKPLDFGGVTVVLDAAGGVVAKFNREMMKNLVFIRDPNDRLACSAVNSLPALLDELDSLQSRLAAFEDEAERARKALLGVKAMSLQHHGNESGDTLLHALLVEIPEEIDAFLASRPEGRA